MSGSRKSATTSSASSAASRRRRVRQPQRQLAAAARRVARREDRRVRDARVEQRLEVAGQLDRARAQGGHPDLVEDRQRRPRSAPATASAASRRGSRRPPGRARSARPSGTGSPGRCPTSRPSRGGRGRPRRAARGGTAGRARRARRSGTCRCTTPRVDVVVVQARAGRCRRRAPGPTAARAPGLVERAGVAADVEGLPGGVVDPGQQAERQPRRGARGWPHRGRRDGAGPRRSAGRTTIRSRAGSRPWCRSCDSTA